MTLTGLTVTDTLGTTNFPATGGTVQLTPLTYQAGTLRYFMNGVLQTAPRPSQYWQTASASRASPFLQAA